ncbi:MAG: hypothetical protein WCD81_03955 [Candidatus Bathyarchaeia archaeon]
MAEAILVMNVVFFAFEFASPNLFFSHEPPAGLVGPLMVLMGAIPALTVAGTSRIPKVLEYVKKMS